MDSLGRFIRNRSGFFGQPPCGAVCCFCFGTGFLGGSSPLFCPWAPGLSARLPMSPQGSQCSGQLRISCSPPGEAGGGSLPCSPDTWHYRGILTICQGVNILGMIHAWPMVTIENEFWRVLVGYWLAMPGVARPSVLVALHGSN